MAKEVAPTRIDADNTAGSLLAACSDWRSVRRFHVGTGHKEPISRCRIYDCMRSLVAIPIGQFLVLGEESIYALLGNSRSRVIAHTLCLPRATTVSPLPCRSVLDALHRGACRFQEIRPTGCAGVVVPSPAVDCHVVTVVADVKGTADVGKSSQQVWFVNYPIVVPKTWKFAHLLPTDVGRC